MKLLKNVRLTVWGKLLIGLVVAAIAWVGIQAQRESARIEQLASLPPCRLAAAYAAWRLDFDSRYPQTEIAGVALEEFVEESGIFRRAARIALETSQERLLLELETLTAIDSDRYAKEAANPDPFVTTIFSKCPEEAMALVENPKR